MLAADFNPCITQNSAFSMKASPGEAGKDVRQNLFTRFREAAQLIAAFASSTTPQQGAAPGTGKASPKSDEEAEADTGGDDSLGKCLCELGGNAQRILAGSGSTGRKQMKGHGEYLDGLIEQARSKFYSYRLDKLPPLWRTVFSDAHLLQAYERLLQFDDGDGSQQLDALLDRIVEILDRALIVAGAGAETPGKGWIEKTIDLLKEWEEAASLAAESKQNVTASEDGRPSKRSRVEHDVESRLSSIEPYGRPKLSLSRACPRHDGWTLERFEDYMNRPQEHPRPLVFTDLTTDWPAMESRPWASREYLMSQTFGGRRLVPVEIGRSYVDGGWGQELIPFRKFLETYIDPPARANADASTVGYLAQHDLFQQLPQLRNGILVPDFCWASVPGHPTEPAANKPTLEYPQLNAWFGPARTITPLHTDGYHNLLCQVVGAKYVRLYPPTVDREIIRPRGEEMGVDMGNTSELDVGVLEGWDEPAPDLDRIELDAMRDDLQGVEYWECILEPGDALLIPIGWWHYVRSLSVSFSVSFWWN